MTLAMLVTSLTLLATAAMAASAAIQAVRHDMDLFGATVLAIATALGGGTVRDLLLGRTPVFWISDLSFIATILPVAVISYFIARHLPSGGGRREKLLLQIDAMGLALFTLVGIRIALQEDPSAIIAVIIGCITGTVGGMIRDILCNVTPSILKKDLYATISLAGGSVFLLLLEIAPFGVAIWVSALGMVIARLIVIARTPQG